MDNGAFHECRSLDSVNYYGSSQPIDSTGIKATTIFSISISPTTNGTRAQEITVHVLDTYPRNVPFADVTPKNIIYDLHSDYTPPPTPSQTSYVQTQSQSKFQPRFS